jgi:hypothetical protein
MAFALPQVFVFIQKGIAVVLGVKFRTRSTHGSFGKYAFVVKLPT